MGSYLSGLVVTVVIMFSSSVLAVDTTDFTKPGMKQLAVEKHAMEACMQEVDEIEKIRLMSQLNELDNALFVLCRANDLQQAQATALRFSAKIIDTALFQKVQTCTQGMRDLGFLPQLPVVQPSSEALQHICDYYQPWHS